MAVVAGGVAQVAAIIACSYWEGTLFLPGHGKGLFQHYGAWAVLISDPVLLVAAGWAAYRFRIAMAALPLCAKTQPEAVEPLLKPWLGFARARGNGAMGYVILIVVGLMALLNNIYQTRMPLEFYGHDVFDSSTHLYSFVVFKVILASSWVGVYPIVGYILISASMSTWIILKRLGRRGMLCPDVKHPDNCYGLRNFGTLNIALLAPYAVVYSVIFLLWYTHENIYGSMLVPLVVVSALLVLMSYVIIFPVYALLRNAKRVTFASLEQRSRSHDDDNDHVARFMIERLSFVLADASPYTATGKVLIAIIRLLPGIAVLVKLLEQYPSLISR